MKTIKSTFSAILMACTTIPAWGIDDSVRLTFFDYNQHSHALKNIHNTVLPMYASPTIFDAPSSMPPTESCFVVLKNETPIGYAHMITKDEGGLRTQNIQELAIDTKHQSKGYGSLLLETATNDAIKNQCSRISLTAVDSSISFYEQKGFSKQDYVPWFNLCFMVKKLR